MGIAYSVVEREGLMDSEVLMYIPRACECGAEIHFTESLRQIYCPNDRCIYKVASRIESMAKAMKADGWGNSTCVQVCKEFNIVSPFQVFLLEEVVKRGYRGNIPAFDKKVASICDREKRRVRLWEVVKLASIQNIDTIAYKIFGGYDSIEKAYIDIENGQVPFIANKLGIKSSEGSVLAVNIYKTLLMYKDELLFGEKQFEIIKVSGKTLKVAITGGVYGFKNKQEYINYLNSRYSGKLNVVFANSVTNDIDVLVADGDTSSNKFKTALKINEKYREQCIKNGVENIGSYEQGSLCRVGEKILITDSSNLINILDMYVTTI